MARRYFNWTLAIVLVVAIAVFAGAVFALHRWQRSTRAERALPRGEAAYAQKDWDKAAEELGRYLTVRSDDVPILQKYADAELKRRPLISGHVGQAMGAFQSILRLKDSGAEATEAAKRLVELHLTTGRPGEAEQVASQYLQKNDNSDVKRMLALALVQQRKYPEAKKVLLELVKDHPDDVLTYEILGQLAEERPTDFNPPADEGPADAGTPAADWYDRAVKANPQSALAHIVRGAFHRQHGRRDQAVADLEQAANCDLSDLQTHLRLVQELIRMQMLDKAKEHLTALQAKSPKELAVWQNSAAALLMAGSAKERTTAAETGLRELAADPWDFMSTAAELFVAANEPNKAQDCVSQMRQRGLPSALLAFLDGLVASSQGNLWTAAARWQDAVGQGHKEHAYAGGLGMVMPVRMMLASTFLQLNDIQSATVQLRTLISESPTYRNRQFASVNGRLALARLMVRTRNWAGVLEQAREVQRLSPGQPDAVLLELQARIFIQGEAGESAPNREQAWQQIDKQLTQLDQGMQGAVQVKLLRAQALAREGKSDEAIKLLEEVRSKDPSDMRVILLEAEILTDQDKSQEAAALLRGAIEQFPQAVEPVQTLALLLNRQKDTTQCESVIKEAIARMRQPDARRNLGLLLAELYRFWAKDDTLYQWLTEMAGQFPNDIQIKRQLLACPTVAKSAEQAQPLVDQIKLLEGGGWQWRYEQARVWINACFADPNMDANKFRSRYYTQITTFLQENLLANPEDQASRMLLAAAHEKAGQKQLALSAYREAWNRSPNNIEIITQFVAALYRNGGAAELKEARDTLKRAGEQRLSNPDLDKLSLYGQKMQLQEQVQRGELDSASGTLQELVRKDPNDVFASLALARISMRQGRLDEAEVILKGLQAKEPERISVIQARTRLYILQGNVQEALRLCDETVQKNGQAVAYLLRAWTYASLRENEKAIVDFQQAAAREPNDAGVWVDLATYYQSIGRGQEAIQDIRKALSLPWEGRAVLERVISLCFAARSRTLIQEAETALDKARTADPDNPALKLQKAQFLLNRRTRQSLDEGQRMLREVTVSQPQLSQAWYRLGRSELEQGEPGRALDTALGGLSHNESDRELLLLKADAEAARSPALAVPTLQPLQKQYPNDIEVEMRLASALYKSGKKSEGRPMIEARIKAEPNSPIPVVILAGLLASEERWTEVAEQVTNWVGKHPDDASVVSAVAGSLTVSRNAEALKIAENLLNAAIQRNPNSPQLLSSLALLMMQSPDRTREAAALNRKVLELDPNDVIALNNLAWVLCEEDGQHQEALELADRGLKVTPDYADLLDTRGVALYRLKYFDRAATDFAKCLELYPANARSAVSATFHLARTYAEMGRTDKAQEYLKKAMDQQERIGGLSAKDLADAKQLTEQLQKGR